MLNRTVLIQTKWVLTILVILIIAGGCSDTGGRKLGLEIPKDALVVALSDVVASPAGYNGKTFVMKGIISGQCASLCEFFFKDGVHKATIYPQGFQFPKLPTGKPVTVYVQATSGEEQIVFSALGLRLE